MVSLTGNNSDSRGRAGGRGKEFGATVLSAIGEKK
jgi:hypothetical protein